MATIIPDISRTFQEFLLLPGLTTKNHVPRNVSLATPFGRRINGVNPALTLNVPLVSASMQAVSGSRLSVALARAGGCGFIFCSQSIESQAAMVQEVKDHKAGFVESDSNLSPEHTLADALSLRHKTGHSTIAITERGELHSKLLGILTSKDFWEFKDDLARPIAQFYTPMERLVFAKEGVSLQEATEILWKNKKECLPIMDNAGRLKSLVFRKDYYDHKSNPDELTDVHKRLVTGAALNTRDYTERAPALVSAGVDALCFDSSDGFTDYQADGVCWVKKHLGDTAVVGAGNVVTADGFRYLADAGADFIKVGIGGGSICITREQKGIGRGQASAIIEVAAARDAYEKETGFYIPICSDGGLNNDTHITIALALGADFVMMGKYFAMCDESPTAKVMYRGRAYKPYWGEGSNRARNWQRYGQSDKQELVFEEGIDGYVPLSGPLAEKVEVTLAKVKSSMCNCGVLSLPEFYRDARLTIVSEMTHVEGGTSSVEQFDRPSAARDW